VTPCYCTESPRLPLGPQRHGDRSLGGPWHGDNRQGKRRSPPSRSANRQPTACRGGPWWTGALASRPVLLRRSTGAPRRPGRWRSVWDARARPRVGRAPCGLVGGERLPTPRARQAIEPWSWYTNPGPRLKPLKLRRGLWRAASPATREALWARTTRPPTACATARGATRSSQQGERCGDPPGAHHHCLERVPAALALL